MEGTPLHSHRRGCNADGSAMIAQQRKQSKRPGLKKMASPTARGGGAHTRERELSDASAKNPKPIRGPNSIRDPVDALFAKTSTTQGPEQQLTDTKGVTVDGRPGRCGGVFLPLNTFPRNSEPRSQVCALHAPRARTQTAATILCAHISSPHDQQGPTHQSVLVRRYRKRAPRSSSCPRDQSPAHT